MQDQRGIAIEAGNAHDRPALTNAEWFTLQELYRRARTHADLWTTNDELTHSLRPLESLVALKLAKRARGRARITLAGLNAARASRPS